MFNNGVCDGCGEYSDHLAARPSLARYAELVRLCRACRTTPDDEPPTNTGGVSR